MSKLCERAEACQRLPGTVAIAKRGSLTQLPRSGGKGWERLTGHCIAPLQAIPWVHKHLKTKRLLSRGWRKAEAGAGLLCNPVHDCCMAGCDVCIKGEKGIPTPTPPRTRDSLHRQAQGVPWRQHLPAGRGLPAAAPSGRRAR